MDAQEAREIINTVLDRMGLAQTEENIATVAGLMVEKLQARIDEEQEEQEEAEVNAAITMVEERFEPTFQRLEKSMYEARKFREQLLALPEAERRKFIRDRLLALREAERRKVVERYP